MGEEGSSGGGSDGGGNSSTNEMAVGEEVSTYVLALPHALPRHTLPEYLPCHTQARLTENLLFFRRRQRGEKSEWRVCGW